MTAPVRQAVVLAGGRGTRLGALTDETPKPLLPVGGRPFIEWVIQNVVRQGIEHVVLTTGYRAEMFRAWLDDRRTLIPAQVDIHVEEKPLDTGGALCELTAKLDEVFAVLNGDTLFDASLAALRAQLDTRTDVSLLSIALREVDDVSRYGSVRVEQGTVIEWGEKRGIGRGLINGGVYLMRRDALEHRVAPLSIENELIPELVADGSVTGVPSDGFFIDIGVPETYASAQRSVPAWWEGIRP